MSEIMINEKQLTVKESKHLGKLEEVVRENFLGFVAVGNALAEIRDKRLYRNDDNRTFEGYCRELWEMSHQRADQFIAASVVVGNLTTIVVKKDSASSHVLDNLRPIGRVKKDAAEIVLPVNEAQARELSVLDDPDVQREVWQKIVTERAETSGKITAAMIRQNVRQNVGEQIGNHAKPPKKKGGKKEGDENKEFLFAYNGLAEQIRQCHTDNWRTISRQDVVKNLSTLLDLVAKAGSKKIKQRGCSMELANREKLAKKGFQIFRMKPKELVIEEWHGGDQWVVAISCETPMQLSDRFKELMEDHGNLRA